jgi:hypothetical protein
MSLSNLHAIFKLWELRNYLSSLHDDYHGQHLVLCSASDPHGEAFDVRKHVFIFGTSWENSILFDVLAYWQKQTKQMVVQGAGEGLATNNFPFPRKGQFGPRCSELDPRHADRPRTGSSLEICEQEASRWWLGILQHPPECGNYLTGASA